MLCVLDFVLVFCFVWLSSCLFWGVNLLLITCMCCSYVVVFCGLCVFLLGVVLDCWCLRLVLLVSFELSVLGLCVVYLGLVGFEFVFVVGYGWNLLGYCIVALLF